MYHKGRIAMNSKTISLCAVLAIFTSQSYLHAGHGDPDVSHPDYPSWHERSVIVATNACRMAPIEFRDTYVGDYDILLPENYPPVHPLYWNVDLNRAARAHAKDMANNCGLSHNSCDGTTSPSARIRPYYDNYGGENIATGRTAPLSTVVQWLMDIDTSRTIPAPDNQSSSKKWPSGDGHRKNIMRSRFKEIGVGYAYGSKKWYHFWVQDFGTGTSSFVSHPIAAGSHFFFSKNGNSVISFMANYVDPDGNAPQSAHVVIDGTSHPLTLHLGNEEMGTYNVEMPKSSGCKEYYFSFVDSEGKTWRYPEKGSLVTFDGDNCTESYRTTATTAGFKSSEKTWRKGNDAVIYTSGQRIPLVPVVGSGKPIISLLCTMDGKVLEKLSWEGKRAPSLSSTSLKPGMYLMIHRYDNGQKTVQRLGIVR